MNSATFEDTDIKKPGATLEHTAIKKPGAILRDDTGA